MACAMREPFNSTRELTQTIHTQNYLCADISIATPATSATAQRIYCKLAHIIHVYTIYTQTRVAVCMRCVLPLSKVMGMRNSERDVQHVRRTQTKRHTTRLQYTGLPTYLAPGRFLCVCVCLSFFICYSNTT